MTNFNGGLIKHPNFGYIALYGVADNEMALSIFQTHGRFGGTRLPAVATFTNMDKI